VSGAKRRDFARTLHAHRARKGVFMTTSEFSGPVRRYVEKVGFKISLIDGRKFLANGPDIAPGLYPPATNRLKKRNFPARQSVRSNHHKGHHENFIVSQSNRRSVLGKPPGPAYFFY
jgi:Restriction endonuclease